MTPPLFVLVREITDNPSTILAASHDRARLVVCNHVPERLRAELAERGSADFDTWEGLVIYEVELI